MSERVHSHRRAKAALPRRARTVAIASATALTATVAMTLGAAPAVAAVTLAVSTTGNDANPCTTGAPCKTVQRAVQQAGLYAEPQAVTINVGPGTFAENATPTAALVINGATVTPLSITIAGAGADQTTIKPTTAGQRVVSISGSYPVTLKGVTITGGIASPGAAGTAGVAGAPGGAGGGIARSGSGDLTLTDVVISNNAAGTGGHGFDGTAGTTGTTNGTDGGAATAGGAGGAGGGVAYLGSGNLTITGSTFTGNKAGWGGDGGKGGAGGNGKVLIGTDGNGGNGVAGADGGAGGAGGAIAFAGNTLTITNSTIAVNITGRGGNGGMGGAGGRGGSSTDPSGTGGSGGDGGNGGNSGSGGGVELLTGAVSAALTHVTIAANAVHNGGSSGAGGAAGAGAPAGGTGGAGDPGLLQTSAGLHRSAGAVSLANSLLSNQPANCSSSASIAATYSVAGDDSCFTAGSGLVVDAAAGNLTALGAYGGTTPTTQLTSGNPALGAVPAASCAATDQRGKARPGLTAPGTCSAGAFEPQKPPVKPTITGVVSAAHGATKYGWYRDTVTVTFTCTPGSSPLTKPCPAPMVLAASGANQGGIVTVTNTEGLSASLKVSINIDKIGPKIAIKGVKNRKVYDRPHKITCVASDTLSGPYVCQVTGTAKLVNNNTQVKVRYTATAADKAGNIKVKKGSYKYSYPPAS